MGSGLAVDRLFEAARELSGRTLEGALASEVVEVRDYAESDRPLVLGFWMSTLFLSGPALQLSFRAHFGTESLREVVGAALRKDPQKLKPGEVSDFVREFCNLTTGRLKRCLEQMSIELGIGIPVVVRGFDEVFTKPADGKLLHLRSWVLGSGVGELPCSLWMRVLHPESLRSLEEPEAFAFALRADRSAEGEVDFL